MNPILRELVSLLVLERLENNLFRGPSRDIGTKQVFGGQVLGQAIKAAEYTVEERCIHSLNAYFLRKGDYNSPIIYEVERSRDGRNFSSRRVVAIQHGRPIFTLSASFQSEEEGLDFQSEMPEVPEPEELQTIQLSHIKNLSNMPVKLSRVLQFSAPFDIRPIHTDTNNYSDSFLPPQQMWLKTIDYLPDDDDLHRSMLAYISDYGLLGATLAPHQLGHMSMIMASIDHAMWFHRPFRMDEWILYDCEAASNSSGRGLARGRLFQKDGTLIASTAQEGLIRQATLE